MAQLNGVKRPGNSAIIYEGNTYVEAEAPAQVGDIVRMNESGFSYIPRGAFYLMRKDYGGEVTFVDEDGDDIAADEDFTVFRRTDPVTTPLTTAQLIEQKRSELAELEAQLAEETASKRPTIGEYALVVVDGDDFPRGSVVIIAEEDGSDVPFRAELVVDRNSDEWLYEESVVKLTPAEAKAALIAQVEAIFDVEAA